VVKQCQRQVQLENDGGGGGGGNTSQNNMMWIQISIMSRLLVDIIECIINNAARVYYAEYSLISNNFDSHVFYSLLAGLDAIKFTPMSDSPSKLILVLSSASSPASHHNTSNNHRLVSSPYNKKHSNPRLESFISPIFNSKRNQSNANFLINNTAKKRENIKRLCVNIETRILSKVFYEWLNSHRKNKLIKTCLSHLVIKPVSIKQKPFQLEKSSSFKSKEINKSMQQYLDIGKKLDHSLWSSMVAKRDFDMHLFYQLIYSNGIQTQELRKKVWPYLLNLYTFSMSHAEVEAKQKETAENYGRLVAEWRPFEQYKRAVDEFTLNYTVNVGLTFFFMKPLL
jgi:hypothetical protein